MTDKIVPHSTYYNVVRKVDFISNLLLSASAVISISIILFDSSNISLLKVSNSILSIVAIIYFSFDLLHNYLFQLTIGFAKAVNFRRGWYFSSTNHMN